MNSRPARSADGEDDKGSVEILGELERLREQNARQRDTIARYERLFTGMGAPVNVSNELISQRERIEVLKAELRYSKEDLESEREAVAARLEELRLSLEQQACIEASVIRSERDFRAIVEKNADAIVVLDADGYVRYVNPAAETLFGMPAREMAGKLFGFPIVPHEPVEMYILREFKTFVAVEMRLVEAMWCDKPSYLISLRDMTDRIMAEEAMLLAREGLEAKVRAQTREHLMDVIDRRRMEESLEKSEERYREVVESSNSIILRLDGNGNVTFINGFGQRFFGYAGDEIVGKNSLETIVPEKDFAGRSLRAMMGDVLRRPEDYRTNVNENIRKGGERVWVSWTNKAFYDDRGKLAELLCIGNDVTRLIQAERALEESKRQAELYLDLMGHDINNMHQIALGYLELAHDMALADEDKAEFLDKPIEVLRRSSRLISNVRKMQKLREGWYQSRTMDVCQVLADVQKEYDTAPHKPVKLDLNGAAHCRVRANELLYDVFSNLVVNAIKHTGDRADIFIGLERARENGKKYCRVSVVDNGPGIPDDFKKIIFNRMLQGTAGAKGMGLGLYMVKTLVDSYGGRVWVEDRVEGDYAQGARFVVMLPAIKK